jgi:hypothetical protein
MEQGQLIQLLSESAPQFSWFFGAGASQSAGLPTAIDVIWDLKRRHYCLKENQQVSANDIQNVAVRKKIDSYMQANGFPSSKDADEYSRCFELIFQDDLERQRKYLRAILSDDKISLSLGHRVLAAMMASNAARAVITTNFDSVIEKAMAEVAGKDIAAFHLEGSYAANAALNNDEFPIYTKIHGDFRYQSLKNLTADLQEQNKELGKSVVNTCNRFGLVVVGYSGRDASVMSLFEDALSGTNPFPHGLFWTTLKGRKPLKHVEELLNKARAKGVKAELVEIETFDSLMSRLWRQLATRPAELVSAVNKTEATTVNLPLSAPGTQKPIIRMNALPVTALPPHCFELQFNKIQEWGDLRAAEARAGGRIICTKESGVWAWGDEAIIRNAFGPELIAVTPIQIGERANGLDANLYLKGFFEQAIAVGLARGKPLLHRTWRSGSVLIIDRHASALSNLESLKSSVGGSFYGSIPGGMTTPSDEHPTSEALFWAEAVQLDLQQVNGRSWLLLRPEVWIWPKWGRKDATAFLDRRCGGRFNRQADALLSAWIGLLLPGAGHGTGHSIRAFDGVEGPGNPLFSVNDRTAFSRRQQP